MPDDQRADSSSAATDNAASEASTAETFVDEAEQQAQDSNSDQSTEAQSEPEGESVTASEAAEQSGQKEQQQPKEGRAEKRIKQLTAQLRSLERQMHEASTRQPQPQTPLDAIPKPAKPDITQFETVEAYENAMSKYIEDMGGYREKVAVARHQQEMDQRRYQEQAVKQEQEIRESWTKRETVARQRINEFDTVEALKTVQPSPVMDGYILDSDIGPDMLWYLHENPDEADTIRSMNPFRAAAALGRLEDKLHDQIKGIKPKTPPKPPAQAAGRASAPASPKSAADIIYG